VPADKQRVLDAYLVSSAQIGDAQAWNRLVERWQPKFLRHAWRLLGDTDLAAEAVQDAWLEVFRGIGHLDDTMAFPAWSFRIVSRRCARLIRERQRTRRTETALTVEPDTTPAPSDNAQLVDLAAVQNALRALPAEQRAAIGLFYLEEMSVAEVSVALDIPPGTVKTRLMHARRKLQTLLKGDDHEQD
jgi:RNA polymerase sigma-70 factor (ECF subfamily)